ncbi:unnamed protein product [Didymodactylos carnosus]|uniref:Uncharacterized protein n=1 Tax=Didymodactylos carnosus TaxID=1234261 RepID=A0A814ANR1_9BILA|nr:unnamed protein product [Didymodactylos carnosus]CAF3697363.1 unnamed protein product [Didymodactylos carnosus]
MSSEIKFTEDTMKNFHIAKTFNVNKDRINAMNFSLDGETLISSSDDDSIVVYDCKEGDTKKTLYSKKYGVDLIHFIHGTEQVLHSSTKVDDAVRLLALEGNRYVRYFPGHTKRVVTLTICATEDTFLTGALDNTLRLWDTRVPNAQGILTLPATNGVSGRPIANFDPEGVIFAVGINSSMIKLYDIRHFDKGPFTTFRPVLQQDPTDQQEQWTNMKFSPDGKMISIATNSTSLHLIEAFQGLSIHKFMDITNDTQQPLQACFSPDSSYILCASGDNRILIYKAETGEKVAELQTDHTGPVQSIQFNPAFLMFASAHTNMLFWLPMIDNGINDGS